MGWHINLWTRGVLRMIQRSTGMLRTLGILLVVLIVLLGLTLINTLYHPLGRAWVAWVGLPLPVQRSDGDFA
ncbi:MAG: hypothetical protein OSA42_04950 [Porticoccaceae bacterium]|nr:hypothetical protein [Porticoccaceae bacterium]